MRSGVVVLFGLTSFLAAALLFSVEPMIGKMILPVLGGTPAVWNTCLVYFQVTLLGGYLFAHGVNFTKAANRSRVGVSYLSMLAVLLALGYVLQPIAIVPGVFLGSIERNPAIVLLGILTVSATLPLLMVAATAPLLQCWFALVPHPRASDPYFLYAASNAGSLMALLAYPLLIEPALGLREQSRVWRTGFLLLALLVLVCGATARHLSGLPGVQDERDAPLPGTSLNLTGKRAGVSAVDLVRWLVLVFIPSSWLMGVTTYLTTDLAAIPLLWVIPLAIYLLSFILAFARAGARVVGIVSGLLPYLVVLLVLVMSAGFAHAVWIPLHLAAFFAGCVACHGALARARPAAERASTFYVAIAAGGLLGGIFTALIAPVAFSQVVEYPLAVILACVAAPLADASFPRPRLRDSMRDLLLPSVVFLLTALLATNQAGLAESVIGVVAIMIASGLGLLATVNARHQPMRFALCVAAVLAASALSSGVSGRLIHVERSFFGVVRVTRDSERNVHRLFHGTTLHGQQSLDPALAREPSTYFTRSGPMGRVFEWLGPQLEQTKSRVAILGLGAGTLASYAQTHQRWSFYEIDPVIARIAGDPRFFTYLRDCRAEAVEIVLGDARLRLREAPDHAFGLIVLDAFSSDSLPVHLLSREAIELYRSKLAAKGVLAFNLSNRYLDLDPVLGRQAAGAGLACRIAYDIDVTSDEKRSGKQPSIWAVMAEAERDLGGLADDPRWRKPRLRPGSAVWTDDFSDLVSYIHWLPIRPEARTARASSSDRRARDRPREH
jgi:hypothetical protein